MERIKSGKFRRISSFCVYFFGAFVIGFDFNSRINQSIYYLRELNASYIPLYQGILIANGLTVGSIFGVLFGYLCDRYGNARRLFLFGNTIAAIGTLIYSVPISAPVLVVGQFLDGLSIAVVTVAIAELARMYDESVLTTIFSLFNLGSAIGLVLGPLMNFALVNVNLEWGGYFIHSTNAPGYIVFVLFILLNISAVLFLFNFDEVDKYETGDALNDKSPLTSSSDSGNCSKTYTIGDVTVTEIETHRTSLGRKLKLLLGSIDLLLVYFATFYWTFVLTGMEALIPLIAANWMGYKATQLSVSYIITGIGYIVTNSSFAFIQYYVNDLYSVVFLSLLKLSVPGLVWLMHHMNDTGNSSSVLYYTWVALGSITWLLEDVLTRAYCSKFVPLQFQGLAEGVRTIPRSIGLVAGGLFAGVWYQSTHIVSPTIMVLNIMLILCFVLRRKSLLQPRRLSIP